MVDEEGWLLQEAHEHSSIFKILVWNVCFRHSDIQTVVDDLAEQAPGIAVFL